MNVYLQMDWKVHLAIQLKESGLSSALPLRLPERGACRVMPLWYPIESSVSPNCHSQ